MKVLLSVAVLGFIASGVLAADDCLTFITGGDLNSTAVLSTDASKPDVVFEGVDLADYEPAYIYFAPGSSSGSKYYVSTDLHNEILRPYHVVRATENDVQTMTVQFQGVMRTHQVPYAASITIKFQQSGADVSAYVVRAASLSPLDIELGLDLDAMVDAGNPRAISRPLSSNKREVFNTSVIAMRKPADPVSYVVHEGDTVSGSIAGNGKVSVSHAAADTASGSGYLPVGEWQVVAPNHSLADLDAVEGTFHVQFNGRQNIRQTAYNLKYTTIGDFIGQKTCQFQYDTGTSIACLLLQLRQNNNDVEAIIYNVYRGYYMDKAGYEDEVRLGMDFENYSTSTLPKRNGYSAIATDDSQNRLGVKDLALKFRSRSTCVWGDGSGFFPSATWTVVAPNQELSSIAQVDGYIHCRNSNNRWQTAYNLKDSTQSGYEGKKTFQFQYDNGSRIECLHVTLQQNGKNVEAYTGPYRAYYVTKSGYESEVKLGMDFENYSGTTVPVRTTWNTYATSDTQDRLGIRKLHFIFNSTGTTYAAASSAPIGNDLTFSGDTNNPLVVQTAASTAFPSNGIVTVGPYATLKLDGHVANPRWTQYRVLTNGVLRLKDKNQMGNQEVVELIGGTLAARDEESDAVDAGTRINYLTLMNGARLSGKPVLAGGDEFNASWIVDGDSPSYCESGMIHVPAGGDGARTFHFYVKDATGDSGTDFFFSGKLIDYNSNWRGEVAGYWNSHIVKAGDGTMEISGDITIPNEIEVKAGTLKLAKSGQFKVSQRRKETGENTVSGVMLSGGTLALGEGIENSVSVLSATNGVSGISLAAGSKLSVDSISVTAGASVEITAAEGAVVHTDAPFAAGVRRRITLNGEHVMLDENGNIVPYDLGAVIIFR